MGVRKIRDKILFHEGQNKRLKLVQVHSDGDFLAGIFLTT